MTKEIWKDIEGWEGLYKISSEGRVYSVKRNICKAPDTNSIGYHRVQLCDGKRRERHFVHRLVAKAFVKGYFEGAVVNHKDFNRQNNSVLNLEWTTLSGNSRWSYEAGRFTGTFKNVPYKIVFKNGKEIVFNTAKDCAAFLCFCPQTVYTYLKSKNGEIPHKHCRVVRCASNDYPVKEYIQVNGKGSSREIC